VRSRKDDIIANIGHDKRTPKKTVILSKSLLKEEIVYHGYLGIQEKRKSQLLQATKWQGK